MLLFFFFNDTATTEIYTLSLHDALPISRGRLRVARALLPLPDLVRQGLPREFDRHLAVLERREQQQLRSEEHTSELQSRLHLVCRLLLEKKKINNRKLIRDRQNTALDLI